MKEQVVCMPLPLQRWVSVFMLVSSLGAIVFAQAARTEELHPYLSKKHRLTLGGFWQESEASLTAAREPLEPTAVNLEAMGLKDRDTTWMVEYRFRKNPRWQYSASLYRYSQSTDLTAEKAFNFDGVEVEVGSALETSLTIDTYIFDAMYTLRRTQHSELAIGGGFHVLDNDVIVNSRRRVNGNETAEIERGSAALIAPLPNLRATYFHAFSPKLSLMATAGWLSLSYEQYDGDFRYLRLKAEYLLTDALGVSAGFQFASIDAQENLDRGYNRFDVEFSGLTVGVSYAF
jgi:hypothetical protein